MLIFLFTALALYSVRLVFFLVGGLRGHYKGQHPDVLPFVSVIVPARNEEQTILRCVTALMQSSYPKDRFEVVVVNDRSSDTTHDVLIKLTAEFSNLRIVDKTQEFSQNNLKGKPGALHAGVLVARGELLLLTDADCSVHKEWITSMIQPFASPSVAMVCGFTSIRLQNLFDVLQDVEWLYTQTMARGGLKNGFTLGCFGNNMALRKSAYEAIGGYGAISFSITEDLAMLQHLSKQGYGIEYLCTPLATVETISCKSVGEYLRQKHRWVRGGIALGYKAVLFVVSSVVFWAGLVTSALIGSWEWVILFLLVRMIGDGLLLADSALRLKRAFIIPAIPPAIIALLLLELVLPILSLKKTIVWKNQKFHQ